jgi:hypothetical protein
MFSTQLSDILSVKQCPILIGVVRRSPGEEDWLLISEYEFKLLFKDYTLVLTEEKLTRETFLRVLIIFKEECDDNEQLLVSVVHISLSFCYYFHFSHLTSLARLVLVRILFSK